MKSVGRARGEELGEACTSWPVVAFVLCYFLLLCVLLALCYDYVMALVLSVVVPL